MINEAECVKVPEGYALVPIEPTIQMREALMMGTGASFLESRGTYQRMLSAAPQPEPKAEQQEPVAWMTNNAGTDITLSANTALIEWPRWGFVPIPLYTTPPDLAAEVERHKRECVEVQCGDYEATIRERAQRVAELEAALEKARERFDKLARLGNEPHYGSSFGNQIAAVALTTIDEALK